MGTLRDKNHKFGGSIHGLMCTVDLLEEQINELPQQHRAHLQKIHNVLVEGLIRVEVQAEGLKAISYRFIDPDLVVEDVLNKMKKENSDQRILVVEDDEIMIEIMPHFLKKCGFKFSIVSDVEKAQAAILNEKPAVIILDLLLGESMGGVEILRFIKEKNINSKCIVQTRVDDDEILRLVEELGPDKILLKPFSLRTLETQINGLMSKNVT